MNNWTLKKLEAFGREQLSPNFFMRQMLHSEIAQINGMLNAPNDPELALFSGKELCNHILEPILEAWGPIVIKSAYRSEEVNAWGNANNANCASNEKNYGAHIWDKRNNKGFAGATACIMIPAYLTYFEETGDWASLAWWIHHNIPFYHELCFFKNQCAFNVRWYEGKSDEKNIRTYVTNPDTGDKSALIKNGVIHPNYDSVKEEGRFKACLQLLK